MSNFNIIRETKVIESFRNKTVIDSFDLKLEHYTERFTGEIDLNNDWQIGLIVGNSGTGKTTIARELFNAHYITHFEYDDRSILENMPESRSINDIIKMFNAVGFSAPPCWLKSYETLSNGQKMRTDLANALLKDDDLIVFDEFTSVVDRTVAKIGSNAVQKAIRKTDKKFIAVTCHFDVEEWLLPDWVFNTNEMKFYDYRELKKKDQTFNYQFTKQKINQYGKILANIII